MNIHVPGFRSFSGFLHNFLLTKLGTTSIRVKIFVLSANVANVAQNT